MRKVKRAIWLSGLPVSVADLPYFSKSSAFLAESKYILVLEEIVKQNTAVVSSSSSSCGLATECGSSQTTHGSWCKGTINSPNEPLETLRNGPIYRYMGAWVELYRMAKKAI